ncbi:MAG: FtsQ-type POTRA domain-containing protein [Puniceicoccales bacterium]|jgi:hypothetical protein|nr:FtsQ-type POTRA domain-containing protein [Puniceicoccales bacterium]
MSFKGISRTISLLFAAVATVLTGVGIFISWKNGVQIEPRNVLKKITLLTDGKITSKWLEETLAIEMGADLFSIDIENIVKKLEKLPQIKKVFTEKRYPNSLIIGIEERTAVVKIMLSDGGERRLFLVDSSDGTIFSPICYGANDLADILPAIFEVKASGTEKFKYFPLRGTPAIVELIDTMKSDFVDIFRMVKFIDLRNYDSRPGAIWSTIELHLKNGIVVVFCPQNFELQLFRLDYVLNKKCADLLPKIKKINLSLINDVVVEYR